VVDDGGPEVGEDKEEVEEAINGQDDDIGEFSRAEGMEFCREGGEAHGYMGGGLEGGGRREEGGGRRRGKGLKWLSLPGGKW